MARRSKDWNEGLAKDLQNPKFALEFIKAALDEGVSLQVALGKIIRSYGVIEFSEKVKMPSSNLLRILNPKHNPTQQSLNRLLGAFSLQLTVALIGRSKSRRLA